MLLGIFHSAAASRCACVAQVARAIAAATTACESAAAAASVSNESLDAWSDEERIAAGVLPLLRGGGASIDELPRGKMRGRRGGKHRRQWWAERSELSQVLPQGALNPVLPQGALSPVLPQGALDVYAPRLAPALPEQDFVPAPLVDGSHLTSRRVGERSPSVGDALSQPTEMSSTSPDLPAASARLAVDSSRSAAERHAAPEEADATRVALRAAEAAWAVEAEARRAAERREAEAVAAAREKDAALVAKEVEWQQHQDSNLAELARQKAAAESRAEQADATLLSVYDGARAHTVLSNLASHSPSAHAACCLRSSSVRH